MQMVFMYMIYKLDKAVPILTYTMWCSCKPLSLKGLEEHHIVLVRQYMVLIYRD